MAQRLQNAASRIIKRNYGYVNFRGEDLVKSLNWQTLDQRRKFHSATLVYKCIYGLAPNYLQD